MITAVVSSRVDSETRHAYSPAGVLKPRNKLGVAAGARWVGLGPGPACFRFELAVGRSLHSSLLYSTVVYVDPEVRNALRGASGARSGRGSIVFGL